MTIRVGSTVYGKRVVDGRIVIASIVEIFIDDAEDFFVGLPMRFIGDTAGEIYEDSNLTLPIGLKTREGNFSEYEGRMGFTAFPIDPKVDIDTTTFEFTNNLPSSLSIVCTEGLEGILAKYCSKFKLKDGNVNIRVALVELKEMNSKLPKIGELCTTNQIAWGTVLALNKNESIAAVVPLQDIYDEFAIWGLHIAPGSEIERRRFRNLDSNEDMLNPHVASFFSLTKELLINTKLPTSSFPKYSVDTLVHDIRLIATHYELSSPIISFPNELGYIFEDGMSFLDFLRAEPKLRQLFVDVENISIVFEPSGKESDLRISVSTLMRTAFQDAQGADCLVLT